MARKNFIIKNCNWCNKEYQTLEKRSKFCGRSCSGVSANTGRVLNESTRKKISESLKTSEKHISKFKDEKYLNKCKQNGQISQKGKHKKIKNILECSKRTTSKILKRLNMKCSNCGWNKCPCDIHHIMERKNGGSDEHHNLAYLCPNCHRMAHNGMIKKFITIDKYIGDKWKKYYYG